MFDHFFVVVMTMINLSFELQEQNESVSVTRHKQFYFEMSSRRFSITFNESQHTVLEIYIISPHIPADTFKLCKVESNTGTCVDADKNYITWYTQLFPFSLFEWFGDHSAKVLITIQPIDRCNIEGKYRAVISDEFTDFWLEVYGCDSRLRGLIDVPSNYITWYYEGINLFFSVLVDPDVYPISLDELSLFHRNVTSGRWEEYSERDFKQSNVLYVKRLNGYNRLEGVIKSYRAPCELHGDWTILFRDLSEWFNVFIDKC